MQNSGILLIFTSFTIIIKSILDESKKAEK